MLMLESVSTEVPPLADFTFSLEVPDVGMGACIPSRPKNADLDVPNINKVLLGMPSVDPDTANMCVLVVTWVLAIRMLRAA